MPDPLSIARRWSQARHHERAIRHQREMLATRQREHQRRSRPDLVKQQRAPSGPSNSTVDAEPIRAENQFNGGEPFAKQPGPRAKPRMPCTTNRRSTRRLSMRPVDPSPKGDTVPSEDGSRKRLSRPQERHRPRRPRKSCQVGIGS